MSNNRKAIVVTAQPEATEAGADILAAGGNAVDAAIAVALVQGVVDPLMAGIAGFGSMGLYMPGTGQHKYFDFHAPAPGSTRPEMWEHLVESEARDGYGFILKDRVNDIGYQSICVPASLKAYFHAHQRHGVLPWAEIVQPAIEWAEKGWAVRPHVHYFWSDEGQMGRVPTPERIAYSASGRALYCREDGSPKRVGDIVINRDLGNTLRLIAAGGSDVFYTGEIAELIAADMQAHGGLISKTDLKNYKVLESSPLWGKYRGFKVSTNQPPGGGIMLLEMLNILEHFDLRGMGHNSPEYIRVVAEAMKRATVDKDQHVGDPAFYDVPVARLLSKEHAETAADEIRRGHKASVARINNGFPSKDTTQVCVVDADGNCVTMTHSLGMPSGVITDGLGFMYNGCMGVFDPRPGRAGSLAPGKARFSSICPSIVFKDEKPCLVIGAPGATQIAMGVLQACLNVLDFDMSMTEAVSAARFSATSDAIDLSNRVPYATERSLAAQGYQTIRSPYPFGFAAVHGVRIDGDRLDGGADPGHDGNAITVAL
ncbi:gamma-glutamyltransferase [Lacisediminimonas profundi]|uniref:gamma-glutamyltransferase n=1 Tax=Lacisediminimonas profundi TaxID=2603856 RepID=UPI00124B0A89|nr:gamma-glutamyltransferase [Lacisediminimonas profundi]